MSTRGIIPRTRTRHNHRTRKTTSLASDQRTGHPKDFSLRTEIAEEDTARAATADQDTHAARTPSADPRRRLQEETRRESSVAAQSVDLGFHPGAKEGGRGDIPQHRLQGGRRVQDVADAVTATAGQGFLLARAPCPATPTTHRRECRIPWPWGGCHAEAGLRLQICHGVDGATTAARAPSTASMPPT